MKGIDSANDFDYLPEIESYCTSLRVEKNASEHTVSAYRKDLQDFNRWAIRIGLDPLAVTHRQLRLYLAQLDAARYARSTINRRLSALRNFFAWLIVTGTVEENPAALLQGPKLPGSLPKTIAPADMERLLGVYGDCDPSGEPREQSASDLRNQALLEFLYACGARVSEASALELKDIDFRQGFVKVLGKGRKERILPIHDTALAALRHYIREGRPDLLKGKSSPFVFVTSRGNRMSTDAMRKVYKEALAHAGLDRSYSPHVMRHSFATDVLAGQADLRSVQEMLGHASLSTTQIYTHLSAERLKEAHRNAHPRSE